MRTLFLLLNVYRRELFGLNRRAHMPGKHKGNSVFYVLAALAVVGILALASFYLFMLGYGLNAVGMISIYPTIVFAVLCAMDLITTITRASDVLIKTRDYDLVTSLPIPTWVLAASRVLRLYVINLVTSMIVALPAMVCYGILAKPIWVFYPVYLLCMLLAPLAPVVLASILGAAIALISAFMGNGKAIRLILSFLFPLAIMVCSFAFSLNANNVEGLMLFVNNFTEIFQRIWPLSGMFSEACVRLNPAALLEFAGISLGAFLAFCLLFGSVFVRLNTFTDGRKTRQKTASIRGKSSMRIALYRRELRRYLASNIYVMNTAFGMLLSLIGVIALVILGMDKLLLILEITGSRDQVSAVLPFVLAMLAGMSATTGSCISLEGRSLWIVKSMPVRAFDWFMSKVYVSLTVALPVIVLDGVILGLAIHLTWIQTALCVLIPAAYAVMIALIGLFGNLHFHRFDWTNETAIVKQSFGAMIPVLLGMVLGIGPAVGMYFLDPGIAKYIPWIAFGGACLLSLLLIARLYATAQAKSEALN